MIKILTPVGEFEIKAPHNSPKVTEDNIDEVVAGLKKYQILTVGLVDGSQLILPESWCDNYAVRVYLDEEVTDEETHKLRHEKLHNVLDELVADFIDHHPDGTLLKDTSVMHLIQWSYEQTINPSNKE